MSDLAKKRSIDKFIAARRGMPSALRSRALDVMVPHHRHFMAALNVVSDPRHGVSHGAMVAARLSEAAVRAAAKVSA